MDLLRERGAADLELTVASELDVVDPGDFRREHGPGMLCAAAKPASRAR